jgi:tryptophan synthase alpha chain
VAELASGYIYYVSLKGVTGAGHIDTEQVARQVPRIQQATSLPVGVGFGIKDGETAARVAGLRRCRGDRQPVDRGPGAGSA